MGQHVWLVETAHAGCYPMCRRADRHKMRERRKTMKSMITWNERPQGTPIEYENAQKRILEVFSPWKSARQFQNRVVRHPRR